MQAAPKRLILASGSTYKIELFSRLGLPFEAINADIDETPVPDEAPQTLATRLAAQKAQALTEAHPDAYILGCDQVIAQGDQIFHKPRTEEGCFKQLNQLQGKTHELICAIALYAPGAPAKLLQASAIYEMHMRPLSEQAIRAYIKADMPLDCAGSYKLEAAGIKLFNAMRGDDHTAIIGLPLTRVIDLLLEADFIHPDALFA